MADTLAAALISDVFHDSAAARRLEQRLREARDRGAELAVLPELPLNGWCPASNKARNDDAEPLGGPRCTLQAAAAKAAGIGLIGGAIIRDPSNGWRANTALIFDSRGELVGQYRKCHLPREAGFWETSHYRPGDDLPGVYSHLRVPFAVQLCSDVNRPVVCHAVAAIGAELLIVPRATEQATHERWKLVLQAIACTSGCYVLSVNRPRAEQGVPLGGPSIAIAPDGRVMQESADTLMVVTLSRAEVRAARTQYPGYLPVRADLYARAWAQAAQHLQAAPDPAAALAR